MIIHVYTSGRFGAENHIGFVIAEDVNCLDLRHYETFDIVKSTVIPDSFWTNPKSIGNMRTYLEWKKVQQNRSMK